MGVVTLAHFVGNLVCAFSMIDFLPHCPTGVAQEGVEGATDPPLGSFSPSPHRGTFVPLSWKTTRWGIVTDDNTFIY